MAKKPTLLSLEWPKATFEVDADAAEMVTSITNVTKKNFPFLPWGIPLRGEKTVTIDFLSDLEYDPRWPISEGDKLLLEARIVEKSHAEDRDVEFKEFSLDGAQAALLQSHFSLGEAAKKMTPAGVDILSKMYYHIRRVRVTLENLLNQLRGQGASSNRTSERNTAMSADPEIPDVTAPATATGPIPGLQASQAQSPKAADPANQPARTGTSVKADVPRSTDVPTPNLMLFGSMLSVKTEPIVKKVKIRGTNSDGAEVFFGFRQMFRNPLRVPLRTLRNDSSAELKEEGEKIAFRIVGFDQEGKESGPGDFEFEFSPETVSAALDTEPLRSRESDKRIDEIEKRMKAIEEGATAQKGEVGQLRREMDALKTQVGQLTGEVRDGFKANKEATDEILKRLDGKTGETKKDKTETNDDTVVAQDSDRKEHVRDGTNWTVVLACLAILLTAALFLSWMVRQTPAAVTIPVDPNIHARSMSHPASRPSAPAERQDPPAPKKSARIDWEPEEFVVPNSAQTKVANSSKDQSIQTQEAFGNERVDFRRSDESGQRAYAQPSGPSPWQGQPQVIVIQQPQQSPPVVETRSNGGWVVPAVIGAGVGYLVGHHGHGHVHHHSSFRHDYGGARYNPTGVSWDWRSFNHAYPNSRLGFHQPRHW